MTDRDTTQPPPAPRYPRDMRGYGARPPDPDWPGGARIAVQVVVNYEEGGENNVLHGDAASEAFLSEIPGAQPWPGQRHWNMESVYEYGARAGFWRLHRLLSDLPVTVYGVATALARSPDQVAAMQDADWEIASHGLKWIDYKDFSPEDEAAHMAAAVRLHTEATGARPRGWYIGRCSDQTVRIAAEDGGFEYIADSYADDLPYWVEVGDRDQLIVPYTLDANDMRFSAGTLGTGDDFETYLRDSFDCLYAEGVAGAPRMMSVGLHCRLAGRPGRAMGLKRFLDHARSHDGVWFATRAQIAEHWARRHPHRRRTRPSAMDREAFASAYGGIVEHSPWVAERAFDLELGPAHDSAAGLAAALGRAFRGGSESKRLAVLAGHPDLAGKLAQARRLTAQSAAEQSGAGLDALTDAERDAFMRLNDAYRQRHGIPFIIAVRDHDKASVLAEFARRLDRDPADERREAERQVMRIARHRLDDLLP